MIVTVVTPVFQPMPGHLEDAYASLVAQELPSGWNWQWLVQGDGEPVELPAIAKADPRISASQSPHGGPGVARTVALSRATGKYVRNLDADDVLPPTALARSIEVLEAKPNIGWTTCRAMDLHPDGTLTGFPDPPEGLLPINSVYEHWHSHDYVLNVHPTTVCIRTSLLLALGGWMALPTSEDTGMLFAANAVAAGWFIPDTGIHYRQHAGQITRTASHLLGRPTYRNLLAARVEALTSLFGPGEQLR